MPSNLFFINTRVFTAIFKREFFNRLSYLCSKDAKKLKNFIKYVLQKILGLQNYLFLFARYVILKLPYDKNEKDFLRFLKLIDDGEHVLDIGANIGVMTYFFSKTLSDTAVHSFEPVPDNLKVLRRIIKKINLLNVKVYTCALGDKNDNVNMLMPEFNKVYFHGLSHIEEVNTKNKGHLYYVKMKRLDDIEELKNVKINAIKIDVEEYEFNVLKGAEELIKRNRPLMYCELWEGENREKSFKFINKLNYKILINKENSLTEYDEQKGFQNFFFIPSERYDNQKL